MTHTAGEFRRNADHCRRLADCALDHRMRNMLLAMAVDFDAQARTLDDAEVVVPD